MIRPAIDRLVDDLGDLSPEQAVHAASAGRLADAMDDEETAPYVLPNLARELRAAVAALSGAPVIGQGVDMGDLDDVLREALR